MATLHAHITYHGATSPTGRTVRERAMSPDMARDTAEYTVRDFIARPDGRYVPTALDLRGNDCTLCVLDLGRRGTITYGHLLIDPAGIRPVGAVHVNLCGVTHA